MLIIHLVRLAAQYRTLVCCLLMWAVVTILGTLYLTSWSKLVLSSSTDQHYTDIRQLLRSRALFNVRNPKIARALKYCSPMYGDGAVQEGVGIPGSTLEAVVVVIRHGDRGPIQDFVNLTAIDCSVSRTRETDYREFDEYMRMTKPKRRSPRDLFQRFPPIPRTGRSCLPGQLSELGALQLLRTGRLLYKAYGDNLRTVDPSIVVSTLYERTYQSAVAFMYGFLPKFDFSNVIFKGGQSTTLCYSQEYCRCPLVEKLHVLVEHEKNGHLTSHPAVQNLLEKLTAVLQRGRRHVSTDLQPEAILDQLLAFVCHQASLPCTDDTSCITVDHLNNLVSFVEWRGKLLARSQRVKLASRLSVQGLLVDILDKMEDIRAARKRHGLLLYSAHDVTLMPLLVAFGFYDGTRPPYSSRLVLELYSRPLYDLGNNTVFHLKILYNGRDVTRRVVFCERDLHVASENEANYTMSNGKRPPSICALDSLAQFVNDDLLKEMNVSSFRQACAVSSHK